MLLLPSGSLSQRSITSTSSALLVPICRSAAPVVVAYARRAYHRGFHTGEKSLYPPVRSRQIIDSGDTGITGSSSMLLVVDGTTVAFAFSCYVWEVINAMSLAGCVPAKYSRTSCTICWGGWNSISPRPRSIINNRSEPLERQIYRQAVLAP